MIEQDGKPAFYVVPAALWERMRGAAEDAEDIADLERFQRESDGVRYPAAVAMADGASPLRAWRGQQTRETVWRDAKIEKITSELARLKRWKVATTREPREGAPAPAPGRAPPRAVLPAGHVCQAGRRRRRRCRRYRRR